MLMYATTTDLAAPPWNLADTPDNADLLLTRASLLVRKATRAARYDVDGAGKPSDPDVLQAFTAATCSQVQTWVAAGIDPSTVGLATDAGLVASKSRGDRSISFTQVSAGVAAARSEAAKCLDQAAMDILAVAGLLDGQPSTW